MKTLEARIGDVEIDLAAFHSEVNNYRAHVDQRLIDLRAETHGWGEVAVNASGKVRAAAEIMNLVHLEVRGHTEALKDMNERLDRHAEILEQHTWTLDEHTQTLDKHTQILNEHTQILNVHTQRFDQQDAMLSQYFKAIDEHTGKLDKILAKLD